MVIQYLFPQQVVRTVTWQVWARLVGSSLITTSPNNAWLLYFDSNNIYAGNYFTRLYGLPVRVL